MAASESLTQAQRKLLLKLQTRQGRRKLPYFLAEGRRCVEEALRHCPERIELILADETQEAPALPPGLPLHRCSAREFAELAQTLNPQGLLALVRRAEMPLMRFKDPFLLVLDGLAEPGNIGTILRTALALGLEEVAFTGEAADPYSAKAVRAGMGAQFRLRLASYDSLAELAALPALSTRKIWLSSPHGGTSLYDTAFDLRASLLVMGGEAHGVSMLAHGRQVCIPMPGDTESLNVAQAATLLLYEGLRQGILGRQAPP